MSQDATPFQPHDAGPKGTHEAAAHAQSPDGRTPFVLGPHDSSSAGRAPQAPDGPEDVLVASDGPETLDEAAVSEPPQLDRRQLIVALAGVLLSILLAALDQTIVGTALPRIVAELNGFDRYSWVVTAYLLTATCVIPIAGKLSDQFGRKPILLFGIVVFVGGSMLCGASQTMNELIVFRGIQGIGAGALQSGAFASIGDLFSPAERGRWQGVIAATFGIASVFGPSLGGWITDNPGWRWVFYVNVPVSIVALLTVLLGFPAARVWQRGNRIDWLGVTTVVAAVVPLLIGLTWAGTTYPWGSPQVVTALGFSVVMFACFFLVERRTRNPLLPLDLFRNRIFSSAAVASLFVGPLLLGLAIYLPLFVQGVLHQSATSSGEIITPLTMATVVSNIIGGQLISRTGRYQLIALFGLAITIAGLILMLGMGANTDNVSLVRNMLITGFGFGFVLPVYTIAVQNALPYSRLGVVTSSVQFTRSIGSTIGVSVLGTIVSDVYAKSFAQAQPAPLKHLLATAAARGHPVPTDPQILVSPQAQAAIQQGFVQLLGPQLGGTFYREFLAAVQTGLLDAIHASFIAMLVTGVLALIATLFLQEIPLRRSIRDTQAAPGDARAAPTATATAR